MSGEFRTKAELDAALRDSAETASARAEAERKASAAEKALDEIAAMLGCENWEYPGQVVRDVRELRNTMVACRPFIYRAKENRSFKQHKQDQEDARELWPRIVSLVGEHSGGKGKKR